MNKHGHGTCCTISHGGGCCCGHDFRHFYTKEEKREYLERYKEQLAKELEAIEEHLNGM